MGRPSPLKGMTREQISAQHMARMSKEQAAAAAYRARVAANASRNGQKSTSSRIFRPPTPAPPGRMFPSKSPTPTKSTAPKTAPQKPTRIFHPPSPAPAGRSFPSSSQPKTSTPKAAPVVKQAAPKKAAPSRIFHPPTPAPPGRSFPNKTKSTPPTRSTTPPGGQRPGASAPKPQAGPKPKTPVGGAHGHTTSKTPGRSAPAPKAPAKAVPTPSTTGQKSKAPTKSGGSSGGQVTRNYMHAAFASGLASYAGGGKTQSVVTKRTVNAPGAGGKTPTTPTAKTPKTPKTNTTHAGVVARKAAAARKRAMRAITTKQHKAAAAAKHKAVLARKAAAAKKRAANAKAKGHGSSGKKGGAKKAASVNTGLNYVMHKKGTPVAKVPTSKAAKKAASVNKGGAYVTKKGK